MNGLRFRLSAIDENDETINYVDLSASWSVELESAMKNLFGESIENEAIDIIRQELIKSIDRNILKKIITRRI